MSITSAIIVSDYLEIAPGETSAGLMVETYNGYVEVFGSLNDSLATNSGSIIMEFGASGKNLLADEEGFIWIGGSAEDITVATKGQFQVYTGGTLKRATLESGGQGFINSGGTAANISVENGGYFLLYGGNGENTVVSSGGSFVVQMDSNSVAGKAARTTVLSGGIMRLTSAGTAEETTLSGGFLEVSGGAATGTILSGGSMRVNEGDTVRNTTLDGGKMELLGATAITTVVNGIAEVKAVSASTIQDLTMNGGALNAEGGAITNAIIDSGAFLSVSYAIVQSLTMDNEFSMFFADSSEMNEIVINGGTGSFTGVSVNGLTAGSAAILSLDETSMISEKAVFADGATVSLAGTTVAFDTALVTETEAQIQGLSAIMGDAVYTLNAAPEIGIYLLATGAPADFDDEVVLNGSTVSLQVNTPVVIGELVYSLNLDETGDLSFSIEENVTPSLAFVNSEWSDLEPGAIVPVGGVTATVGVNAFATGDEAVTALAGIEDPKIRIAGGTAAFSAPITIYTTVYKGAEIISPDVAAAGKLVVNSGATVSGSATFEKGASITINGKVLFDTACASAESAQYVLNDTLEGTTTFELKFAKADPGVYLLLSGLSSFEDPVTFGDYTLEVGADPVTTGGRIYQLSFADDDLVLTVEKDTSPTPTVVYVNSEWQDIYKEGDSIRIDDETFAVFGYDAFLDGDAAVSFIDGDTSVSRDLVFLSGGTLSSMVGFDSFTLDPDYLVTLDGKFSGTAITINAAEFDSFTRRVLIAEEGFGEILPTVTVVGEGFGKEFLDDGKTLLVTSDLVEDTYANAQWTGEDVKDQFVGDMALVWEQNAFSSFKAAADAMRGAEYTIYLTGGTSSEDVQTKFANDVVITANTTGTGANSLTGMEGGVLTVESDFTAATLAGFSVLTVRAGFLDGELVSFGSVTVTEGLSLAENGALYLDLTDYKPENAALVNGLSSLTDTQTCMLAITDDQSLGVYHLATGAAGFAKTVSIDGSTITLTVGAAPVRDGDSLRTFQLSLTEANELELTIAKYRPPLDYVNSEWTGLEDGTPVTIGDTTATIGFDAFATLAQGIAGVADDGEVEIVGGTVSFAEGYSKTITVDAAATVVGKAVFDKAITIDGTIAFDIANATAEAAQFGGFSFITGSTTTAYMLTAATPVAGTYLLATDAAAFASTVQFGDVTLTVGAEAAIVGKYTYTLSLTEGVLALAIEDYIPTLAYVNSEWSDKKIDDIVTVGDKTAIIGFDAFATLAPAIAAVTEDGAVEIVGGTISFADGYSKTIMVDAAATVVGKAVFDKAITINGTIAFDIANATAEVAQFGGFSFITGSTATAYTLTAAAPAVGTYLLATDAAAFDSAVKFGPGILTVGAGAAVIGSYTYALTLNEGTLALTIEDYIPPTPTYDLIYVNSKWASLPSGSTVAVGDKTAVIGEDAFSSGDVAIANVTADGAVEVVGSEVYFTNPISKSVTVDAGATLVGRAAFTTAITVNGTVAFDTQYATEANAQFTGFSFISGNAAYTLTDTAKTAGVYLLATDAAAFASAVKFGNATLSVGAEATVIGDFTYALTLNEGVLALTVEEFVPPTPVYDLVYANGEWAALPTGSTVTVGDKTAVIGEDAFASGDAAILNVTADGTVEVVGGEVFFTNPVSKSVTVDADATLVGKATFAKAITVNGTVAFDTQYAAADDAQFKGFSFVTGSTATAYTLTDAVPAAGVYLLANDAAAFASAVAFDNVVLTVGAEAVPVGDFTYALSLNEGALVLTVEDYVPPVPALAYVNSEWSELEDGTPVQISETVTATIGYNAFAALAPAIAGVTEDGAVEIVGGEVSFSDGYSKTITVDAEATVVGTAVFDQAITINGTVAFDTDFATAEDAQFKGFSFVSGTATYTLTDSVKAAGTYLLATGVEAFTDTVAFDDVTLTVGAEAVPVGDFTYALTLNEGTLALTVEDYIPPTPALAYVNSEWTGLADKTVVTVGEKTAVIGYDAFAELAPAIAAVTDDGAVEIAGGTVSFAKGYSKTITVDADATVVGNGSFKTPITVNGTIAFDTQYATAYLAQYTTFSNIVGSASYTLTDSVKAAGTYQLATGAKGFKGDIKLSVYTLKVGGSARRVGNFTYAVSLMGGSLSLTVAKAKAPSSRPKLVYVNSAWADMNDGTLVKVDSTTYATLGKDAFADGDTATSIVSPKGEIRIVGGSAAFTDNTHNVTVSSGAVLDLATEVTLAGATVLAGGAMTAGAGAVVDGLTLAGDGAAADIFAGGTVVNASISESATVTVSNGGLVEDATVDGSARINVLSGGLAEGIGLSCGENEEEHGFLVVGEGGSASGITVSSGGCLATDNGSFLTSAVIFGGQTDIGGTATRVTLYDSMNVTGWGEVSKAKVSSGGIISTFRTDGVGSVLDSEILSGGIVRNAGFVSEMQVLYGGVLETFDGGIAESTEVQSGGLLIVSGSGAEASGLSLVEGATVTVTDGATLTGQVTAGSGATIGMDDGTVLEFDLSVLARPADYVLVNDFSAIDGTPDLVLTVSDAQEGGVYLLAGGAASFDRGITLGEYTLTLESEPVAIGTSTFSLNLSDDGVLSLLIDVPVFYVNSEWADLEDGTVVTVEGVDAVIGENAFATGDAAAAASPASAEIRVVGGTVSFTDGILKQTVLRSGVELTNTDVYGTLTIEDGAVLSGKSVFGPDAAVFGDGQIVFDTQYVEEDQPQFAGLSRIESLPAYVLASGATVGNYLFATDAADMLYLGIQVADGVTAFVGRAEFPVLKNEEGDQLSYVFDVTRDNELTLSVVKVRNELDNGWNNYVYDKKTKVLNPLLDDFVSTALEDGVKGVLLDEKGTVFSDGRRNYAGGIKGGVTDEYDYAKITLEKGARLSFNLESTGAGKFTVWQLVEGTDKKGNVTYTMKSLLATSLKKDKNTGLYAATTKDLLIEADGDYYISMQATEAASKKGGYAFYNVELNYTDDRTHFFVDGDDGWNDYVYDTKQDNPLNPAAADGDLLVNTVAKAGDALQLDSPGTEFQLDNKTLTNFAGFGDDTDYAKIALPYDSALAFNVTATDAAKFTIWQLVVGTDKKGNVTYKMKLIQTTALKKDKNTGLYSAETALRRFNLDDGNEYYVSVQSTNAKKGGSAYYSIVTSGDSVFYTNADNGWNDYVYDKKREEPLNMALYGSVGTLLYKNMGDIQLDAAGSVSEQIGGTTFTNYVGFGDDADYLKITLENTSKLSFNVTATNASKFVIYQLVEGTDKKGNTTYKMKEIQSTALKKADKYAAFYTVAGGTKTTGDLAAGDYYIAVVSTNAKKGDLVYYNVSLNDAGCSGLPDKPVEPENFEPAEPDPVTVVTPEDGNSTTDSGELTGIDSTEDDLSFAQTSAAASPDLSAGAVADIQESKSAWQAMLA